jgi:hypothetical protein
MKIVLHGVFSTATLTLYSQIMSKADLGFYIDYHIPPLYYVGKNKTTLTQKTIIILMERSFSNILIFSAYTRLMIIIVYGSILRPSSYNRAALVGCHGRQLHPIFANWLYQLPTLPLPFSRVMLK